MALVTFYTIENNLIKFILRNDSLSSLLDPNPRLRKLTSASWFLSSGLGPFVALVVLNVNIYLVIRRRRLMTPRLQNSQSAGERPGSNPSPHAAQIK